MRTVTRTDAFAEGDYGREGHVRVEKLKEVLDRTFASEPPVLKLRVPLLRESTEAR